MIRWTHGHTLCAGALGGVALADRTPLLIVAAVVLFAAGVGVGRFWLSLVRAGRWFMDASERRWLREPW